MHYHALRLPLGLSALVTWSACSPPPQPAMPAPAVTPCPTATAPTAAAEAPRVRRAATPDTPSERALAALFAEAWDDDMREDPTWASLTGDRRFNDRWPEVTPAAFARRDAHDATFLARARAIADSDLSPASQLDRALFERAYATRVEEAPFGFEYMPVDQQAGAQTSADLEGQLRFETLKDYEDWIRRIDTFGEYVGESIDVMRLGVKKRLVRPRVVMDRVAAQVDRLLATPPEQSAFYKPFTRFPASIAETEKTRLALAAKRAIATRAVPAYRALQTFLRAEYLPACFTEVGLWQIPRGDEAYAFLARMHTTTAATPTDIHALGEREVARIHAAMQTTMEKTGFKGTLKEFFTFLRTDPRFFLHDPNALLERYRATAKRTDPLLVKLFKTLPRTPYGVEPVPAAQAPDQTTAYYVDPAEDGSRAGTYFVNLYKPESRPTWEMTALTLHESVPGHHLQIALAHEQGDLPLFRRNGSFTAFVEGWGLYAESLGDELGLYDDPYAKFGQLAYEMWRAIRLVVDTGLHAMHWDRQKAIDYFTENDPKAPLDIANEIDRYIAHPGQALAYKIGELKIKELRARATAALGAKFDVRAFHDVVLEEGAVPLDVLEHHVDAWIGATARPTR